jgi:hypothetical protein
LSEGHPEKSPMLEDIVDRMLSVPWSNKIKLNYSEKLPYSYYDGAKSTINVVPSSDSTRMLQETANNAWYATHQFLDALYDRKLPQDDYVKTKVRIEVEALKAADAIRKEVTGDKGAPVKFQYRNEHGQVELLDVRDYLQNHSDKDLAEFIRKAGHTDQSIPHTALCTKVAIKITYITLMPTNPSSNNCSGVGSKMAANVRSCSKFLIGPVRRFDFKSCSFAAS